MEENSKNSFLAKKTKIEEIVNVSQKEIIFKSVKIKRENKKNVSDTIINGKLMKNKISARKSRLRKKEHIQMLEAKVLELEGRIENCTKINQIGENQYRLLDKVILKYL